MPRLTILGTSSAVPDAQHDNTHMVLVGEERTVLIDCANSPVVRLAQAGVPVMSITDLVLTHFHPDHVAGAPSLLMDMWLLGRKQPLPIYGLAYTLDRLEKLMGFYSWENWPNFFPVSFHRVPEQELVPVLECAEFRILASPVKHLIPTIGLRVDFPLSQRVLAYSCDTQPTPSVVRLAAGADLLIHEASGATLGHSSAAQAGLIAREAEVGGLYLIHYPPEEEHTGRLETEAAATFGGAVQLARDLMTLDF